MTVFLWCPKVGNQQYLNFTQPHTAYYENNPICKSNTEFAADKPEPVIAGQFTNWKPVQMMEVNTFCRRLSTMNLMGESFKTKILIAINGAKKKDIK